MLFRNARIAGQRCNLRVEGSQITALGQTAPRPGEEVIEGGLITPPFAEPHVHLDAALLGARTPNLSGTLTEGIQNWSHIRPTLTAEDVSERARTTLDMYRSHGCLRIRTHVDTGSLVAVEALCALRDSLTDIELQVVAFPQEGILRAEGRQANWEAAVEMGCDAVGVIPHFERTTEEGWQSVRMAFDLADKHGKMVDLHCDETDDPGSRNLEVACTEAIKRGWKNRVIAGHCTAMHSYPNPYAAKVIALVAESGVQVVTNPLDNIVLQGRYDSYPRRRGHTRVDELWDAGCAVGIGHDSVQDPWYRLGTANMLDAAYMLVHYAQLTSDAQMRKAFRALHDDNHQCFGGPPTIVEGGAAQFLWWPHDNPIDVLIHRPKPRVIC
jgi:cytosine deaminase